MFVSRAISMHDLHRVCHQPPICAPFSKQTSERIPNLRQTPRSIFGNFQEVFGTASPEAFVAIFDMIVRRLCISLREVHSHKSYSVSCRTVNHIVFRAMASSECNKIQPSAVPSAVPSIVPIANSTTEEYIHSLSIPTHLSEVKKVEIVSTLAARYKRHYLETRKRPVAIQLKTRRTSGRKNCQLVLDPSMAKYKIDDMSMGFSWWKNENERAPLTQKEHNTSNRSFVNGFNGDLKIMEIAGPQLAYTCIVPFMTQFGLMSAFKTQPNDMLIRETMKELSSMKHCYYTQLHWRKGNGNSSHVNESDWRDNPFLDPTSAMIVEGYLLACPTV